ncbi:uncharacterized protein HMPREF1541_03628 [Cyphellophora europaea CBS 101466]|uniref:Uncharacterized protein n=1 Tax=Cyphellophora europaea (strain CBS 101466) TaxID=1220924 RepID=W2RZ07_CYPE1|nr:uncharacterized protein HMPREF1541_03628 [Cyphellophora europaea CBS 101466]ETN41692.1 hypothetical protein HMPREF1541_03628 [Cyphellophora europaea CBS 101466]
MSSKPDDGLSTHVLQPLGFAAKIGLATGITGFTGGGVYGFFRSAHPLPFAAAVGLSSGYYGASTIFMRGLFLDALPAADREKRSTKILATGLSGAVSGAVAGLWQRNPIWRPAGIIGLLTCTCQIAYSATYDRLNAEPDTTPFLERVSRSRWMPLKSVSDEDYETLIRARIDRLDTQITVVDGQIAALQQQKASVTSKR